MLVRPLFIVGALLLGSSAPLGAQGRSEDYGTVVHDCALPAKSDTLPESPEWQDERMATRAGREGIVVEASQAAFDRLRKCGTDSFIGTTGVHAHNGITKFTNEDGSVTYDAVLNSEDGWSTIKWTITIKYTQVQRKRDVAARSTCGGNYSEVDAQPQYDMPVQRGEKFVSFVEVFPAVFERGEYLIPAEADSDEPWARDPVEAIKMVLLHEIGHLEAYATSKVKQVSYPKVEDTEVTADDFASSVVRCN